MGVSGFTTAGFTAQALQNIPQQKAPVIGKSGDLEKIRKTVEDFESFFLSQTFQTMYDTVPVNETFGGGHAEKLFRSMLTDEYGKMAAKSGGIGISDAIMRQIIEQQSL